MSCSLDTDTGEQLNTSMTECLEAHHTEWQRCERHVATDSWYLMM